MATNQPSWRIDTHIHSLPAPYKDAVRSAGGDPSGFPEPEWSPEATVKSMEVIGTDIGILSISAPGVPIAGTGSKARQLARELNIYLGNLSTSSEAALSGRFGFFGALPDWRDVEGTIAEIDYLYGKQKLCSGVGVYTSYGGQLLGDLSFKSIWSKLQECQALVFLHPGMLDVKPTFVGGVLPQPVIDYPIATTRTAVDLVVTGTVRACPDVDIILSHAGGCLPFIGTRAIGSFSIPAISAKTGMSIVDAKEDFDRFYYDMALSCSPAQLNGLLDFIADPSHVVFGSDFPYAPPPVIMQSLDMYNRYVESDKRGSLIAPATLRQNAVALLNKHSQGRQVVNDAIVI